MLKSADNSSIESINTYPMDAINVESCQQLINLNLSEKTVYVGPLLSTTDFKSKRLVNVADLLVILSTDSG